MIKVLKCKIHRAVATGADLDYEGSILIDSHLMEMAGLVEYELVHVWNCTNGNRFETYAIPAKSHSGEIVVNGAAAHLVKTGDKLIIAAFSYIDPKDASDNHPKIVLIKDENKGFLKA